MIWYCPRPGDGWFSGGDRKPATTRGHRASLWLRYKTAPRGDLAKKDAHMQPSSKSTKTPNNLALASPENSGVASK